MFILQLAVDGVIDRKQHLVVQDREFPEFCVKQPFILIP